MFVDRVATGLQFHEVPKQLEHFLEVVALVLEVQLPAEFLAEIVALVHQRPARMFFLVLAGEIGRITDLRLHFLFTVAKIIIGDDGDDHSARIATGDFEGLAGVVKFRGRPPTHSIAALAFGRRFPGWQTQRGLR